MAAVPQLTLHTAAAALARGEVSSVELCQALLDRCVVVDERVGAFLHMNRETALAAALASDERRVAGQTRGPYDGVPVAVKDNLAVTGQPCGCASNILDGYTAPYDATVIAKLRQAGVVPMGRTNMDEFAMGSSTENSGKQLTANPWDLSRVPGGSSGGSTAAVASRMALAALGSDTGGSIRQPAGFCGVVGLKPSYGRVSRYGLVAYASSLDQIGPITQDVRDSAVLLQLISGLDPMDSTSLDKPVEDYAAALGQRDAASLRVGLPKEYFDVKGLSADVRQAVEAAAKQFEDLGAEVVEVSLPHTEYAIATYYIIATAEASANLARFDGIRYGFRDMDAEKEGLLEVYRQSRAKGFGTEVKRRIILGTYVLSSGYYDAYYLRAQKVRTLIRNDFTKAFETCDIVLAPSAPDIAWKRGEMTSPLQMYLADIYTISANLAGICGITVPCGLSSEGMPIGLQMLAPVLGETTVLQAAYLYEQASGCGGRVPELVTVHGRGTTNEHQ